MLMLHHVNGILSFLLYTVVVFLQRFACRSSSILGSAGQRTFPPDVLLCFLHGLRGSAEDFSWLSFSPLLFSLSKQARFGECLFNSCPGNRFSHLGCGWITMGPLAVPLIKAVLTVQFSGCPELLSCVYFCLYKIICSLMFSKKNSQKAFAGKKERIQNHESFFLSCSQLCPVLP